MEVYELTEIKENKEEQAAGNKLLVRSVEDCLKTLKNQFLDMSISECRDCLLSELNYSNRYHLKSSIKFGYYIKKGDICYIDYGRAYIQEVGYQHFGLVISIFDAKALVIPMTSNYETYRSAYDPIKNPNGLKHLFKLGKINGLDKYSVLFLNDGKYINTARVINVKGRINPKSKLFKKIMKCFINGIISPPL